jgi:hypothetical protein
MITLGLEESMVVFEIWMVASGEASTGLGVERRKMRRKRGEKRVREELRRAMAGIGGLRVCVLENKEGGLVD